MKHAPKAISMRVPGTTTIVETYYKMKSRAHFMFRLKNSEALFTYYYRKNTWGDQESVSGSHSTVTYTQNIRKELPLLIDRLGVKRILDAPCGDYNWFRLVPRRNDVYYVGADIVKPLIIRNQEVFGSENTSFMQIDVTKDELPNADLWICRDCLFHFSNHDVFRTIHNFLVSDIRYLLTTTYPGSMKNIDVPTGGFRFLNLELPPFSFCKPIIAMDDWIEGHPVKELALWGKEELLAAIVSNKALQRWV
jgi:SAM-dependent methyltransferase